MDKQIVRETYLDVIKGLAMLLVVMQHVGGRLNEGMVFLCKIDVPLFFVVSGYLAMKLNINVRKEFGRKLKRIVLPYVISLLFASFWYDQSMQIVITDIGKCGYWFLQCLFFFFVLFYLLYKICGTGKSFLWCSIVIELLLLILAKCTCSAIDNIVGISYMARYFPCFIVGAIIKRYSIQQIGKLLGSTLLVTTCVAFTYKGTNTNISFLFHVLGYICSSVLLFYFIKYVKNDIPSYMKNLFSLIGKNSLAVYIIHFYFVVHISSSTGYFSTDLALVLCVSLIVVFLSIAIQKIFQKMTYLSQVL